METKVIKRDGSRPVIKVKTILRYMKNRSLSSISYQEIKRILKVAMLNSKVIYGWNNSVQKYGLSFKMVPSEVPGQFKEKRICFSKPIESCLSEIEKTEGRKNDSTPVDKVLKSQILGVVEDLSKKNNGIVKFRKILDIINTLGINIDSLELLKFFKGEKKYYFSPSADGGEIKVRGEEAVEEKISSSIKEETTAIIEEATTKETTSTEEAAPTEETTTKEFSFYTILSMSKKDLNRYFPEKIWEIIEELNDNRNIVKFLNLKKEDLKPFKYLRDGEKILDDKVQKIIEEF